MALRAGQPHGRGISRTVPDASPAEMRGLSQPPTEKVFVRDPECGRIGEIDFAGPMSGVRKGVEVGPFRTGDIVEMDRIFDESDRSRWKDVTVRTTLGTTLARNDPYKSGDIDMDSSRLMPHRIIMARGDDALTELEVLELAARMLDAEDEAAYDDLLATAMTHAAARSGVILSPDLGSTLGGMLKKIARRCLSSPAGASELGLDLEGLNELESAFETNMQLVRLTGEAARQAAEEFVMEAPDRAAVAALAAAANLYAPPLAVSAPGELDWDGELGGASEIFEYDPEMEYFLGGLIHSAVRTFNKVKNVAGDVARVVNKAANAVGKIPILGDITRAGIGAARLSLGSTAMLIDAGSRIARGENIAKAVKGAVMGQVDAVRDQLKLAEMVAPFVPGVGAGVGAALGAANALAAGKPITEAVLSAARSSVPGGAIAQAAFDVALNLAKGKSITDAVLATARDRLPGGPAARAAFDTAVALGKGKSIQDAAFAAAGRILPASPLAADALDFAKGVAKGQNIQNAALSVIGNRVLNQVHGHAALAKLPSLPPIRLAGRLPVRLPLRAA